MELKKVKTIGIIGVGFMGGSLALDLRRKFKNIKIIGYARSQASFRKLKSFSALDRVERDQREVAAQSDILVLAAPVKVIIDQIRELGGFLKEKAVVFDLGSSKKDIEAAAKKFIPKSASFVGCHPFCGSEETGFKKARPGLYRNSFCFITSSNKASFLVEKIWEKLGSKVIRLSPAAHDSLTCSISHFPHLLCFSLTYAVPDKYLKFSSSGFRDLTRIASSSDKLWSDIFLTNKGPMLEAIDKHIKILARYRKLIEENDKQKLQSLIKQANQKRSKII